MAAALPVGTEDGHEVPLELNAERHRRNVVAGAKLDYSPTFAARVCELEVGVGAARPEDRNTIGRADRVESICPTYGQFLQESNAWKGSEKATKGSEKQRDRCPTSRCTIFRVG